MNRILVLLFLIISCISLKTQAQGYIVTKTGDTLHFEGDIDVPSAERSEWTMVGIGKKIYVSDQLDCMFFKNEFYKVIHGRFYQRVIQGRISVYALNVEDTLSNERGYVHHRLFIQGVDFIRPKRISNYHLHQIMKDPMNMEVRKKSRYSVAAIPFLIYGSPGVAASLVMLGGAAVSANTNQWAGSAGMLAATGALTLAQSCVYFIPGVFFYISGRRVSLKVIHRYNAMKTGL